jgi:hypothetical protein
MGQVGQDDPGSAGRRHQAHDACARAQLHHVLARQLQVACMGVFVGGPREAGAAAVMLGSLGGWADSM